MRDLGKYAAEAQGILKKLKIKYAGNTEWKINTRAKTRLGVCKKTGDRYVIEIAAALLDESAAESELKNTVMHELLHTCRGCMSHTGRWRELADRVNAACGLSVSRTTERDKAEIPDALAAKPKYRIVCTACGAVYERFRRSRLTDHPEMYKCGRCGGSLKKA